jgi:hypothetical protein
MNISIHIVCHIEFIPVYTALRENTFQAYSQALTLFGIEMNANYYYKSEAK